jgi:hypothetical protein
VPEIAMEDQNISVREWVDREDRESTDERVERLEWLIANHPPIDTVLFPGGFVTQQLFEESRHCFVYAHFLASVLLSLTFIERVLAAQFYGAGRDDLKRAGIKELLSEASKLGLLSQDECDNVEKLRTKRNALVHFREYGHEERVETRSVHSIYFESTPLSPEEIVANDAVDALQVVFHLLGRACTPNAIARFIMMAKKR